MPPQPVSLVARVTRLGVVASTESCPSCHLPAVVIGGAALEIGAELRIATARRCEECGARI